MAAVPASDHDQTRDLGNPSGGGPPGASGAFKAPERLGPYAVLAEVAREIASGRRSWNDTLAIRDEWKSLPSGTMQNLPEGTEVTLREAAEAMISISDNTATDHLVHFVQVEHRLL